MVCFWHTYTSEKGRTLGNHMGKKLRCQEKIRGIGKNHFWLELVPILKILSRFIEQLKKINMCLYIFVVKDKSNILIFAFYHWILLIKKVLKFSFIFN